MSNCFDCSRHKDCLTNKLSTSSIGNTNKLLVVTSAPTYKQDLLERSTPDENMKSLISDVMGLELSDIVFTSLVRCYSDRDLEMPDVATCYKHFEELVSDLKPKCILGLGSVVNKFLGGKNYVRGEYADIEVGSMKVPFVGTHSQKLALDNFDMFMQPFITDFSKAYSIACGAKEVKGTNVVQVTRLEDIQDLCIMIGIKGFVAFDFETSGLAWYNPNFYATCISLTIEAGTSYVVPIDHFEYPMGMAHCIKKMLEDESIVKVAHNAKFDMHVAKAYGVRIGGLVHDTMLMHHLLDETVSQGLKNLVKMYLPNFTGYEDVIAQYKWDAVPFDVLANYAGTDTDATFRLYLDFHLRLLQDNRLPDLYSNLVLPFLQTSFEAEHTGMLLDKNYLDNSIEEAQEIIKSVENRMFSNPIVSRYVEYKREQETEFELERLKEKIKLGNRNIKKYEERYAKILSGEIVLDYEFNLSSTQQLEGLLYSKHGFGFIGKGAAKEVLAELKDDSGFIKDLQLYRSLNKTVSTYLIGIRDLLDSENRVHTSFLQHGSRSGRISASNPNLQNLPDSNRVKDEEAKKVVAMVKKAFVPPVGHYILQLDFSQAELRVAAEFADEDNMLEAYNTDKDLHAVTGATSANLTIEQFYELSKEAQKSLRQKAKAQNFGLLYGMSADGFKHYAKNGYGVILTDREAEKARNAFFKTYPKLSSWHELYRAKGKRFGYVRTLFGRKRHLPFINSYDRMKQGEDERVAINSPVQGTAAEFTLFGIVLASYLLPNEVVFVNTIHDSVIYYVPFELLDETLATLKKVFEQMPTKPFFGRGLEKVGMKVDIEISKESWKDMQPI